MKAIVKFSKQINLEIEGDKVKDVLWEAINIQAYPKKCDECGNTESFEPRADSDKDGNKYVKIVCTGEKGCGAQSNMGTYKAGGHFWKKFENWQTKTENRQTVNPSEVPY